MSTPRPKEKTDYVRRLVSLLKISEDEVLSALLSAFVPSNPGSLAAAWAKRTNYAAPTGQELWAIMKAADFRCEKCHTHFDLTFHHRNDNAKDARPENLQYLCRNCNRETSRRPVKERDQRLRIFKAYLDLHDSLSRVPSPVEVLKHSQVSQLSGSRYMLHFLNTRLGAPTTLRPYTPRPRDAASR